MFGLKKSLFVLLPGVVLYSCGTQPNDISGPQVNENRMSRNEVSTNVVLLEEHRISSGVMKLEVSPNRIIKEKFSFYDLQSIGSSPAAIKAAFNKALGKDPDGICFNSETYFNAVKPAITEQYGYLCYKEVGTPSYTSLGTQPGGDVVIGSTTAINESDAPANISVEVSGSWNQVTSWKVSQSVGLSFNTSVSFTPLFSVGGAVSYTTSIDQGGSKSSEYSVKYSVSVEVPPRSKKDITVMAKTRKESMGYELPIVIDGDFGANYDKKVDDHYYWFLSADEVLPFTTGIQKGTIDNVTRSEAYAIISQAVSL